MSFPPVIPKTGKTTNNYSTWIIFCRNCLLLAGI
ncbi:LPXTG cell wall anchor domain-containing protein [Lactobacillus delbrueckii]|nr:LPXTG cell wall anchor domain-containing protein [Lactobacillus delbrueckii]